MTYDYKVEPIPKLSGRLLNAKSIGSKSAELLQKVLETEAKADWEFLDVKTISCYFRKLIAFIILKKSVLIVSPLNTTVFLAFINFKGTIICNLVRFERFF